MNLPDWATYLFCSAATCLMGWWLWRSWRERDDSPLAAPPGRHAVPNDGAPNLACVRDAPPPRSCWASMSAPGGAALEAVVHRSDRWRAVRRLE